VTKSAGPDKGIFPHLREPNSWELCDPSECDHFTEDADLWCVRIAPILLIGILLMCLAVGAGFNRNVVVWRLARLAEVPVVIAATIAICELGKSTPP
jgi:hypothetical protein